MESEIFEFLKQKDIQYKLHTHPPVFSVEESKKIKHSYSGETTKCLFLKDEKYRFYLVCLVGTKKLNTNLLRKYLNIKKLNFATKEELFTKLKVTPGSVSILCLINTEGISLIVDKELFQSEKVGFHPSINTKTLEFNNKNFKKLYSSLNVKKEIISL